MIHKRLKKITQKEETMILELLMQGVRDGEEIVQKAQMSAMIFNQTITMLEIKGQVRSLGMNQWCLN